MTPDEFIQQLGGERQKLLDALDANEDIKLDNIFGNFYPDEAHFVYELLQNAEDAAATCCEFLLSHDQCVFRHDGEKKISEQDVRAITAIDNSTKANDPDKIGEFGIGFKSVFAYASSPEVYSRDFSFRIKRLMMPELIEPDSNVGDGTKFCLRFDNPDKPISELYAEVKNGLENLSSISLLFLRNIKTVAWAIEGEKERTLSRIDHPQNHIEILAQSGGRPVSRSHYLRFTKAVEGLPSSQKVAIAFELEKSSGNKTYNSEEPIHDQFQIAPANPGRVAVYFVAKSETSGLRFHLHAPFIPELSRASIKEERANEPLYAQIAELTASALHSIRDLKLLTRDFLAVLPNPKDSIPKRYECIRVAIVDAMNEQPLTPTHTKSHAPAKHLLQATANLKQLLIKADLRLLVDYEEEPPSWAIGPNQKNSDVDRFLGGLQVTDWGSQEFLDKLDMNLDNGYELDEDYRSWLSSKPPEWHQKLYAFINRTLEQDDGIRLINFKVLCLVRLNSGKYAVGAECFSLRRSENIHFRKRFEGASPRAEVSRSRWGAGSRRTRTDRGDPERAIRARYGGTRRQNLQEGS